MLKMGYIILEVYIQIQRRVRQNNLVVQASLKVSSNRWISTDVTHRRLSMPKITNIQNACFNIFSTNISYSMKMLILKRLQKLFILYRKNHIKI